MSYPILENEEKHKEEHERNYVLVIGCIFCEPEINKRKDRIV